MAATTFQSSSLNQQQQHAEPDSEGDNFLVPSILSESDERTPNSNSDTELPLHNGDTPPQEDFNNFPNLTEKEINSIKLEVADSGEDDEDVVEMPKQKKSKQGVRQGLVGDEGDDVSNYLLKPFFKSSNTPTNDLESEKQDNAMLEALFAAKEPKLEWQSSTSSMKRSDVPQELDSESTPVPVKRSSLKRSRKPPPAPKSPLSSNRSTRSAPNLKEGKSDPNSMPLSPKAVPQLLIDQTQQVKAETPVKKSKKKHSTGSGKVLSSVNGERLVQLKQIVDAAIREHKVYSMTGAYHSVRKALRERGWIEKIDSDFKGRKRANKFEEIDEAAFEYVERNPTLATMKYFNSLCRNNDSIHYSGQGEAEIINRMLRHVTEDLCWLSRPYPYYCWKDIIKFDMVNRLPKAYFSNKVGLCNSLQQIQWFYEPGVCTTRYPRTYNISLKDEYEAFREDFRITSCISTLKWLVHNYKTGGEAAVRSSEGKVDISIVEFALRRCAEFVKHKEHEDIDIAELPTIWEHQWDHFLTQYYKIVNEGNILANRKCDPPMKVRDTKVQCGFILGSADTVHTDKHQHKVESIKVQPDGDSVIQALVSNAQSMLNLVKPYWPQIDIEGTHNLWIVKPGARCCGNGIVIKNQLDQILTIVNPSITRETRYVVQKYIERPYLIYNTKFDIRQWFLVTNVYPLTIWMYKESYLRFCSHPFTLKNTHESVHLSNNAVQRRYKNAKRDRGLPDENMWDCYTFQTYLKATGHPDVWEKVIYPGMKEGFVGALLASQDNMERRRNCFELYGADFMVSDQLTDGPWLIEINSNPAMDSSTSITARMCPQVLEDIIKVVIDRRTDRTASTGAFEMVYKQNCPAVPPYLGMTLCVRGKKLYRPSEAKHGEHRKSKKLSSESDSEESVSADETTVSKRCSQDFMQPIKKLIDTIKGSYSTEDIMKARKNCEDNHDEDDTSCSDSVYYDSASSKDYESDAQITMTGKEMELKPKKKPKTKHRKVQRGTENDASCKSDESDDEKKEENVNQKRQRGKTDWIRKNIEQVRGHSSKRQTNIVRRIYNETIHAGLDSTGQRNSKSLTNIKDQVQEELKNERKFREEMIKMLSTEECVKFITDPTLSEETEKNMVKIQGNEIKQEGLPNVSNRKDDKEKQKEIKKEEKTENRVALKSKKKDENENCVCSKPEMPYIEQTTVMAIDKATNAKQVTPKKIENLDDQNQIESERSKENESFQGKKTREGRASRSHHLRVPEAGDRSTCAEGSTTEDDNITTRRTRKERRGSAKHTRKGKLKKRSIKSNRENRLQTNESKGESSSKENETTQEGKESEKPEKDDKNVEADRISERTMEEQGKEMPDGCSQDAFLQTANDKCTSDNQLGILQGRSLTPSKMDLCIRKEWIHIEGTSFTTTDEDDRSFKRIKNASIEDLHLVLHGKQVNDEELAKEKSQPELEPDMEEVLTSRDFISNIEALTFDTDATFGLEQDKVNYFDFDSRFEKELSEMDQQEFLNNALNITQQTISEKSKVKRGWNSRKTSMEYFNEWKYKVDETRRNCEDMLAKLKKFKEDNSKIKFHDVLRTRIECEAEFLHRLKQRNKTSNWMSTKKVPSRHGTGARSPHSAAPQTRSSGQGKLEGNYDVIGVDRQEVERPTGNAKPRSAEVNGGFYTCGSRSDGHPNRDVAECINAQFLATQKMIHMNQKQIYARCSWEKPKKRKPEQPEAYSTNTLDISGCRQPGLVITSESGAVKNVSQWLPKIKQRNQALLPNGSNLGFVELAEDKADSRKRRNSSSRLRSMKT